MAARTEEEQAELVRIWDAQERELVEFRGDIGEYLETEVLEIKREQYLDFGKWKTSKYILVTGTGGPHVEFDTNHMIAVYWAGGVQEYTTDDKLAVETINAIADYLDEIYPE